MTDPPPLPPAVMRCSCGSALEVLTVAPRGMVCRACGTWVGKVYTDQAVLDDVIVSMRPPQKKRALTEALGLPQLDVLCRSCGRSEAADYDWLAARGECSVCRRSTKRERRLARELRSAARRKARKQQRSRQSNQNQNESESDNGEHPEVR